MKLIYRALTYLIIFTSFILVLAYYYIDSKIVAMKRRKSQLSGFYKYWKNVTNQKPNVRLYDLKGPLDPIVSDSIECRFSAEFQQVSVTLCLHEKDKDVVSKALWKNGLWEEHIMSECYF